MARPRLEHVPSPRRHCRARPGNPSHLLAHRVIPAKAGISVSEQGFSGQCPPSPPPSLPHQGGGAVSSSWYSLAPPTDLHLPLDGGGWEGVSAHAAAKAQISLRRAGLPPKNLSILSPPPIMPSYYPHPTSHGRSADDSSEGARRWIVSSVRSGLAACDERSIVALVPARKKGTPERYPLHLLKTSRRMPLRGPSIFLHP